MNNKIKVAVLDDYQNAALKMANWTEVQQKMDLTIFNDHISSEADVINRLLPFELICVMRERTPLTRSILSQLPNLKLIVSTGMRNASIDSVAAEELGIRITPTRYVNTGAPEFTWAMLMAIARHIPAESNNVGNNEWQKTIGTDLAGKTIGIIGLGNIGKKIAAYAKAFDMNVIAWSENLTKEKAEEAGAVLVSKDELFTRSDFITIHLVLSGRSKGIIQKKDLDLMKPSAYFINTSRGPLVNEQALIEILQQGKISGAAIDVYDTEPLPADHPFRKLSNVLATPHIGYVTEKTYRVFYEDTIKAVLNWVDNN